MGNARRDGGHRVQRLSQLGLRETVKKGCAERWHHADRMTRSAAAAFVERIGLVGMRAQRVVAVCAIVTAHIHMLMLGTLHRSMVVLAVIVRHARAQLRRLRRAKRHGRSRVALEGHREHHEPQQDCAKAGHCRNCRAAAGQIRGWNRAIAKKWALGPIFCPLRLAISACRCDASEQRLDGNTDGNQAAVASGRTVQLQADRQLAAGAKSDGHLHTRDAGIASRIGVLNERNKVIDAA